MEIDESVEFFNAYLDSEYAAAVAARTEPDEVLDERTATLETFMHAAPGTIMSPAVGRGRGWTAERLEKAARTVNEVARRNLFLVVEYKHSDWHSLFAGYVSGPTPLTTGSYGQLLYACEIDGLPKIIAEFFPEILEPAPPMKWSYAQGAQIGVLSKPKAIRALSEPTFAEHQQDWEAIQNSAP
ncbi:hypothetical protein [Streptomyces atratus]|uniref:hypothetical protein n=1 Tax=Streptomyces atratus TaxID=1893 RepID=UPI00225368F1|nr:hypothetical protein [Streptomyces atratus]MCX5342154.1 hypothetical protein [Streptomyces atratus]